MRNEPAGRALLRRLSAVLARGPTSPAVWRWPQPRGFTRRRSRRRDEPS